MSPHLLLPVMTPADTVLWTPSALGADLRRLQNR